MPVMIALVSGKQVVIECNLGFVTIEIFVISVVMHSISEIHIINYLWVMNQPQKLQALLASLSLGGHCSTPITYRCKTTTPLLAHGPISTTTGVLRIHILQAASSENPMDMSRTNTGKQTEEQNMRVGGSACQGARRPRVKMPTG